MDMGVSCRKNAFFQAPIKLAQPFPGAELRTEFFTDTRIFLINTSRKNYKQNGSGSLGSARFALKVLQN